MIVTCSRLWRMESSKSVMSWDGVTFNVPVPNSMETTGSPMIFSLRPTSGRIASFPMRWRYRIVLRIHRNCGITQHGLGPGGSHNDVFVGIFDGIPNVPEITGGFFMLDFKVRKGRMTSGTPVNNVIPFVNKSVFVKSHEHLAHCPGKSFVHGESFPIPIAGAAESFELIDNHSAGKGFPGPDSFL